MMSKNQPAIQISNLTKRYGDHTAVKGVSFEVQKGTVLAILGPNGAGKTSTLEMLEGYREPTSGTIKVLGADPQSADRVWRSQIGMVLQSTSLDSELTVHEVLHLYQGFYQNPRSVAEVLELVGLHGCEQQRVGHLSGGQQRRVDVAIGIIGRPELLFLDEPTTGFDPVARRDSWNMVKRLCQEGMTVVLTTHYMDEAKFLADRILVFVDGKIVADAHPSELGESADQQSIIGFSVPAPDVLETLPAHIRSKVSLNGNYVSFVTEHVHQAVDQLMRWARRHHLQLNLTISRPSLEETYLRLVNAHRVLGARA